jgi:hypothetical protein
VCDKGGCGFEKAPGKLPEMKDVFLASAPAAARPKTAPSKKPTVTKKPVPAKKPPSRRAS